MAARNRVCYLCGAHYDYCPTCSQDSSKPTLLTTYCSQNCADIFRICMEHSMGLRTTEEAQKQLKNLDLSRQNHFMESIRNEFDKIMAEEIELDDPVELQEEVKTEPVKNDNFNSKKSFKNFMNYNTREVVKKKK